MRQFPRSRLELRATAARPQPAWRQGPDYSVDIIVIGQDCHLVQYKDSGRAATVAAVGRYFLTSTCMF